MTSTNPRQLRWDAQTLEAFQRRVQEINEAEPWRQQTVAGLVREVLAKAAKEWEAPDDLRAELDEANAACSSLHADREHNAEVAERFDEEYSALFRQNARLKAALAQYAIRSFGITDADALSYVETFATESEGRCDDRRATAIKA